MSCRKNACVFLDRDGTIIEDKVYLADSEKVEFLPDVIPALKLLKQNGFKIVIITNQSGIARKLITLEQLRAIHNKLKTILSLNNVKPDAIFFCPHHPDDKCSCRKPNLGMALRAKNKLNLDLKHSFSVGDKITDVIFAKRFGGKGILVLTGLGKNQKLSPKPDYVAENLHYAAKWIIKHANKK